MLTIWKYHVKLQDQQRVNMPDGADILDVQYQHDQLTVWALVDPTRPTRERILHIAGNGHPVDAGLRYIATVQQPGRGEDGARVWHVFEA